MFRTALISMFLTSAALADNLLKSPSFETGNTPAPCQRFCGWNEIGAWTVTGVAVDICGSGTNCQQNPYSPFGNQLVGLRSNCNGGAGGVSQSIKVTPGSRYLLSVWARGWTMAPTLVLRANAEETVFSLSTEWEKYEFLVQPESSPLNIAIEGEISNMNPVYAGPYIDNAELYLISPTTWTVDDDGKADFDNIQAAIDAAIQGDEIIVMPGTYTGTGDNVVDMLGKLVWLHSSDGPEVTFINGEGQRRGILSESFETSKTIIEGFTIQNGYATDWNGDGNWPGHHGAGMLCDSSNPTITNCTFANNLADNGDGGGLYLISSSSTVTGCVFINNSTAWHGGGVTVVSDSFGGFSNPLISNCNFSGNTAEGGGGLCCYDDGLTIEYCTFDANIAGHGGGMYTDYCDPTLTVTNCTFTNNVATGDGFDEGYGGGMDNWASNFTLTGCVFRSNIAGIGGAIRNNVAPKGEDSSNTTLTDTLVCGNSLEQISGQWTDHGGNTVAEECPIDCTSDINVDGNVDVNDLLILIADWGTCTDNCVGDVNEDGTVDVNDLLILIAAWGPCE